MQMESIGMFLGVEPYTGGMSQYAKALLDALRLAHEQSATIKVAYVSSAWQPVLESYPFETSLISAGKFGVKMADGMMAARVPARFTRILAGIFNPIPRQLSQLNCDLWIFPAQDSLSYQVKLPVMATIHDLMHLYESSFPEVSSYSRRAIREHRFSNLAETAKAILVDSKIGRQHVTESYQIPSDKIYPLPFVAPPHSLIEKEPDNFEQRYQLPEKFIFYPAQYWAHKNHKRLISAAAAVKNKLPDIVLVFTGAKNRAYEDIFQHVVKLEMSENIIFMDQHIPDEDLVGFYRRARAMMMPTFFGPTNIPPLEAIANGCPVGVSRIYGMPEQLKDAALFFDPNSEQEIAEVMEKLWLDDKLCQQLIAKGRDKTALWGQKQFAERFCEILARIEQLPV